MWQTSSARATSFRASCSDDELVEIFGARFACVDKGFGNNKPVDVVIRPEDIDLVKPDEGTIQGVRAPI